MSTVKLILFKVELEPLKWEIEKKNFFLKKKIVNFFFFNFPFNLVFKTNCVFDSCPMKQLQMLLFIFNQLDQIFLLVCCCFLVVLFFRNFFVSVFVFFLRSPTWKINFFHLKSKVMLNFDFLLIKQLIPMSTLLSQYVLFLVWKLPKKSLKFSSSFCLQIIIVNQ